MTARDELQQWVDDRPQWRSEAPISTDLAHRVLAEMDEAKAEIDSLRAGEHISEWADDILAALDLPLTFLECGEFNAVHSDVVIAAVDRLRAERDAALAKLDAVRAWTQNGEAYIRGGQRKELFRILDGEGASDG